MRWILTWGKRSWSLTLVCEYSLVLSFSPCSTLTNNLFDIYLCTFWTCMHQLLNTRKVMFNHSARDWDPRGITRTWSLGSLTVHLLVKCKDLYEASHIIEAKMNKRVFKVIPLKQISYPHFFKLGTIVSLVLGCQKCNKRIASFSKRKGKKRTMNITETYLGPIFFLFYNLNCNQED